ncbi:cyanoexosortase B [Myxacorys almedinensis]|uniref:Cyanoexosortase B n=1 Tax=Myxacorys almedinensis A TaxID=2690445 RepID=A0A8J7YY07_9CYAN|nr:cyanoexosortase B [Myxacorys almedinensis]NDJ16194.1 cyanoexosortase B [Myxacorys almedinensis A]
MQTARISLLERYWSDAALLGLLTLMYAPLLLHWGDGWLRKSISIEHEYFSHGLIGLPFAAYIAWMHRKRWQRLTPSAQNLPSRSMPQAEWGGANLLGAGFLLIAGVFYLSGLPDPVNLSFPLLLTGLCLWLKGLPGLKLQAFPLLLVFLATPNEIPYLITPYTLPLQAFIAGSAGFILTQLGMDVTVQNIYLLVGGKLVEVAPYCAGLKMLFTSLYVALMLLYWTDNLRSRQIVTAFLAATIALSILSNIVRNTLLAYFHGTSRDAAFRWLHDGWGGDAYSAAMLGLLVLLLHQIESFFAPTVPQDSL